MLLFPQLDVVRDTGIEPVAHRYLLGCSDNSHRTMSIGHDRRVIGVESLSP